MEMLSARKSYLCGVDFQHSVLNSRVCEPATISQRSINDDDKDIDEEGRSLLSSIDIVRMRCNFDQLLTFAVELFI